MNDLIKNILSDIRVEVLDETNRNFQRKGFFKDNGWMHARANRVGSLMNRTGTLARSIEGKISNNRVEFSSSVPYASIHNQGGTITVTEKMKRFFWAKYAETKDTSYKYMALMPVGKKIVIPQRQYIGPHPDIVRNIEQIISENISEYLNQITSNT